MISQKAQRIIAVTWITILAILILYFSVFYTVVYFDYIIGPFIRLVKVIGFMVLGIFVLVFSVGIILFTFWSWDVITNPSHDYKDWL